MQGRGGSPAYSTRVAGGDPGALNAIWVVAAALLGASVGSFLNVVIYRVPEGRSVVRPPSACPGCGAPIAARDNIPVLSWLALRGRCRGCARPISARYPAVEALTAALWVALYLRFGRSPTLPAMVIFVSGLVALAFIDFDHLKLPRVIVWPLGVATAAALVGAAAADGQWHRLAVAAASGAAELALLFAVHWASPRSLGFGDVRLGPVIGLALGWLGWRYALWAFVVANALGAVVGLGLVAAGRGDRRTRLPFGVFLAAGAVATLLYSGRITLPR
jgi:leader peptidase (prepilin peptidase)/N-methyltransferase